MKQIIVAKSAGFCFGVKRAVEKVYEQVENNKGQAIYTFGPIIHNEEVVKDLEQKGVTVIETEEELKQLKEGIVITSNGGFISRAERQSSNSRIQGSASTVTKLAMINVSKDKELNELGFRLLICVHD